MKKRIKLLSIISALLVGATMTFSACGKNEVPAHDHEWDNGTITKESTCFSEGVKTYTCTFDGCGQTKTEPVGMTAHTWNDGEITTDPTCEKEGVKTYTCTVDGCGKKKEEAVDKAEHKWNGGEVTKVPEFAAKGVKTLTCQDCGEKKEESVAAHADFAEQYYTAAANRSSWSYGYASTFNLSAGEVEFAPIAQADAQSGTWKADGVEIGKGYVYSANHAMIIYNFTDSIPEGSQTDIAISFKGKEGAVLKAYLFILDDESELLDTVELNASGDRDWSYTTDEAIDVAQGYSIGLVFDNAGTGEVADGELSFTLTAPCVHVWNGGTVKKQASCVESGEIEYICRSCDEKRIQTIEGGKHEYEEVVISEHTLTTDGVKDKTCAKCGDKVTETKPAKNQTTFADDFKLTENGEFAGWEVGVVNFHWPENYPESPENFDFTKITAKNTAGDAYNDNTDGWKEIKGDWMASNGMTGFAYHFYDTATVNVEFNLHCTSGNGKYALRWAIKDKDGNIKNADGKAQWGSNGHDITFEKSVSVVDGDVLYLLVGKEEGGDQSNFDITLTKVAKFADFGEDFAGTLAGENNGWQAGYANYHFDGTDTFDFTAVTNVDNGAFKNDNPFMEVKGDWMASKSMVGLAYTFGKEESVWFKFDVTCAGDGMCAVRWAVKDSAGNIKNGGKATWGGKGDKVTVSEKIEVEEGDVLFVLIGFEEDGNRYRNDQKNFTLTLSKKSD